MSIDFPSAPIKILQACARFSCRLTEVIWEGRKVSLFDLESLDNYFLYAHRHLIGNDRQVGSRNPEDLTISYSLKDVKKITLRNLDALSIEVELLNGKRWTLIFNEQTRDQHPETCRKYYNFFCKLRNEALDLKCFNRVSFDTFSFGDWIDGGLRNKQTIYLEELESLRMQTPALNETLNSFKNSLSSELFIEALNEIPFEASTRTIGIFASRRFTEDWQNLFYFSSRPLHFGYSCRNFLPSMAKHLILRNWDMDDYENKVTRIFRNEVNLMKSQGCTSETIDHALRNGHFFLLLRICLVAKSRTDLSFSAAEMYREMIQTDNEQTRKQNADQFADFFNKYKNDLKEEIRFLKESCDNYNRENFAEFLERALDQGLYGFVIDHFLIEQTPILEDRSEIGYTRGFTPFNFLRNRNPYLFDTDGKMLLSDIQPGKVKLSVQSAIFHHDIERLKTQNRQIPDSLLKVKTPTPEQIAQVQQLKEERIEADRNAHLKNLIGLEKYAASRIESIERLNATLPFNISYRNLPFIPDKSHINPAIEEGNYLDAMKTYYAEILKDHPIDNIDEMILDGSFGDWLTGIFETHSNVKPAKSFESTIDLK